jgi:hypothetical protein
MTATAEDVTSEDEVGNDAFEKLHARNQALIASARELRAGVGRLAADLGTPAGVLRRFSALSPADKEAFLAECPEHALALPHERVEAAKPLKTVRGALTHFYQLSPDDQEVFLNAVVEKRMGK